VKYYKLIEVSLSPINLRHERTNVVLQSSQLLLSSSQLDTGSFAQCIQLLPSFFQFVFEALNFCFLTSVLSLHKCKKNLDRADCLINWGWARNWVTKLWQWVNESLREEWSIPCAGEEESSWSMPSNVESEKVGVLRVTVGPGTHRRCSMKVVSWTRKPSDMLKYEWTITIWESRER